MQDAVNILKEEYNNLEWELDRINKIVKKMKYESKDTTIAKTVIKRKMKRLYDSIRFLEGSINTDDLTQDRFEHIKKPKEP